MPYRAILSYSALRLIPNRSIFLSRLHRLGPNCRVLWMGRRSRAGVQYPKRCRTPPFLDALLGGRVQAFLCWIWSDDVLRDAHAR